MLRELLANDSAAIILCAAVAAALFLLARRREAVRRLRQREDQELRRLIRRCYRARPARARVWVDRDGFRWN